MSLSGVHRDLALTVIVYASVMGVWAAVSFFRRSGVSSSYRGALVIGELLMILQGVLGALLWILGLRPGDILHILYGVLVVLAWPAVYVYTNARQGRAEAGTYSVVSFFMAGLAIRAMMTGYG